MKYIYSVKAVSIWQWILIGLLLLPGLTTAQQKEKDGVIQHAIRIKLTEQAADKLAKVQIARSQEGYVLTGMPALDRLSQENKVTTLRRVFRHAGKYEAKHRKHGLHLWYEASFDAGTTVSAVRSSFSQLSEVQIAENIYAKKRNVSTESINAKLLASLTDPPDDTSFSGQWHYNNTGQTGGTTGADISLLQAWGLETGSSDVIVAVTDGGIDVDHADIASNVWINEDEIPGNGIDDDGNGFVDDVNGYGFGDNTGDIAADLHGTHVGGTVAATTNNSVGVAGVAGGSGVGDGARVMSCAAFGQVGTGGFAETYTYGADNGAVISQNSWGYTNPGVFEQAVLDAIDYFIAEAGYDESGNPVGPMQGGIVIFAAGNDGVDGEWWPAIYEPVVAVAGSDHNDNQYVSSNRGDWVELTAPAVNVLSTFPNDQYGLLTGTSMACPHVSGAAALIISKFEGNITPQQVRDRLIQTTDQVGSLSAGFGSGRLNAFNALQENDGSPPEAVDDLAVDEVFQNSIELSWTAPSDPGNGSASIYDLRYSTSPITEATFDSATVVENVPNPGTAGTKDSVIVDALNPSTTYYFALKSADFFGNISPLSNVASGTTENAPVISISPDSLDVDIDVSVDPVETASLTIENQGDGADLNFEMSAVILSQSQSFTNRLFPGEGLEAVDMSRYGAGNTEDVAERALGGEARTARAQPLADVINTVDSIVYDEPDNVAEDFGGLTSGAAYSSAVRFDVEQEFFNLTHVRNFFRTETATDPTTILEIYEGETFASAELLLSQEVTLASEEGEFFVIPLEVPQNFSQGDVFWIVNKYPNGVPFPQGTDVGFTQRPNTFFFSGDGGVSFSPSSFVFKVRALSASGLGVQWITFDPQEGTVPPGGSENVAVTFDASTVPNGEYGLNLMVNNNDPINPEAEVPTTVTVSGQMPDILIETQILEFGSVFIGASKELPVTIINNGLGDLEVSDISSSGFAFVPDTSQLSLAPGEEAVVNVTFSPSFAGNINGTLTLESNDPDQESIEIVIVGVGTSPPVISVEPEEVSATLDAGETTVETIEITNLGNYPLTFSFPDLAVDQLLENDELEKNNTAYIEFAALQSKSEPDTRRGHPVVLGAGADTDFGYKWIDSDEEGGPSFVWDDISETGTEVNENSDDGSTEIELPFNFNFYGEDKTTVSIGSNGYLTFGSDGTDYTNDQIPDALDPNDYIAPFWDDLRPSSERGNIYYEFKSGKLIVQYHEVGNYASSGTATFQVVIYSSGNISYYYHSMSTLDETESATIGIENADGTDGAQVVFNNTYVKDSLAVSIMAPQPNFIADADPLVDVVPVNQSVSVDITLDATELNDGTYTNELLIASNDPANPETTLPFELTVIGMPIIEVEPDSLEFDSLFVGLTREMDLNILNTGTKVLEVASITNSSSEFQVDFTGPASIEPGLGITVPVIYEPATIGPVTDEIVINSDDSEGNEMITVPVSGIGVDPPVIDVSPDSLAATVEAGEMAYDTLYIANNGAYELTYALAGTYWFKTDVVQQAANSPIIDFGNEYMPKGAEDTRVGHPALSGGGADNSFGYIWEDTKDGGGPEYDWNDISGSGEDITEDLIEDTIFGAFADGAKQVPLGFDFTFYGQTYDSIWVSANGIMSFTEPGSTITNTQIPAANAVNNLIAGFWDDLEPGAINGTVVYESTEDQFTAQFTDVARYGSASEGLVTFQMIVYPNGNIKLQYEDVETANYLDGGTVGIENETGTDGAQVVFNNEYIEDELAIMFEPPVMGTVAPGDTAVVAVTFDASGLNDGVYEDDVIVSSNDPVTPEVTIPVTLTVIGMPEIAVMPDSLDFGQVFVHADSVFSKSLDVVITNTGSKLLNIDSFSTGDDSYTLSSDSAFSLEPNDDATLTVTFTPDSIGTYNSALVLVSDSELDSALTVPLFGEGVAPPMFTATTPGDSIYAVLKSDGTALDNITVGNVEGGSLLTYTTSVQYMIQSAASQSALVKRENPFADINAPHAVAGRAGVSQGSGGKYQAVDEPTFTDSLSYDDGFDADDFVGIPDETLPFSSGTKFTAPEAGFVLTHVRNFYRSEGSTDSVNLEVYRGGTSPLNAELVASQMVYSGTEEGDFELITLESPQAFAPDEVFWVVFHYPVSVVFSQGINDGLTGLDGIFVYSNNGGSVWTPAENDLPGTAFKVRALQSVSEWITLSPEEGEVPAGDTEQVSVMMDASEIEGGDHYASVRITSNDPFNVSAEIPVHVHVNELPVFTQAPADTLEVNENDEITVVLKAEDNDGEILVYTLDEMYNNVSFDSNQDSATVHFEPDFSQSGYYTFTVNATDDMTEVGTATFVIQVNDVNRLPEIVEQIKKRKYRVGEGIDALNLTAYIKDPDLEPLTFTATAIDSSIVDVSVSGQILFIEPLAKGGTFVSIIADDGHGGQVGTSFEVRVRKANAAPVVTQETTDQDLTTESVVLRLSEMFEDPDGDILSYNSLSSDENVVTTVITDDLLILIKHEAGEANVTVNALDGKGGEASTSFMAKVGRVTGVEDEFDGSEIGLTNYPNPMRNTSTVNYILDKSGEVRIDILSTQGQLISVLVDERQTAGEHEIVHDRNGLNRGVYLYRVRIGDKVYFRRLAVE